MSRLTAKALLATALIPLVAAPGAAQDYGNFDGYTLRVKLIGGAQYEPLYSEIAEWEEMTGATVEILSRQNHFELDREIKQDIAARTLDWCVGSNHTSFAPQYGRIYVDLRDHIAEDVLSEFVPRVLEHSTVGGRLVQLPRHSDVSNLFYIRSIYEDEANQQAFEAEYGYALTPPETWAQVADHANFFADPPDFYGTQYVGKDEAVVGRFYEMLVAEGGQLFSDDWEPTFNSEAGVRALDWFVDLYEAGAVPRGVPNYLWDDTGLGFASGSVALNLDWAGWSAFFNDPENSSVAGDIGLVRAPMGSAGVRTGWAGVAQLLDHRDLRQHGGGGLFRDLPDRPRPADGRGAQRPSADAHAGLGGCAGRVRRRRARFHGRGVRHLFRVDGGRCLHPAADPRMDRGFERDLAAASGGDRGRHDLAGGA